MKDLAKKVIYKFEQSDNHLIKSLSIEDQIELIKEIVKILRTWKKEDCVKSDFFLNENFRYLSDDAIIFFFRILSNDYQKANPELHKPINWCWSCFIADSYSYLGQVAKNIFNTNSMTIEVFLNKKLYKQFQEKYLKDFE